MYVIIEVNINMHLPVVNLFKEIKLIQKKKKFSRRGERAARTGRRFG